MTVTCTICNKTEPTQEQFERFHIPTHEHVRMVGAYEKGIEAGEYKQAALVDEQAATIARLTAAHEMQGESLVVLPRWMVSNMEDKLKEQAAEIERLTEKVRYAYVQIEALERVK